VAHAADTRPEELVRTATREVIAVVSQDAALQKGDPGKTHSLVESRILPHFDFRRMTQLAVGREWGKANEPQRQALVDAFRGLLVRTYSTALGRAKDHAVEVKQAQATAPDDATVKTTVTGRDGSAPIAMDYRLHRSADGWKVYDVAVEGVSLVTTYRGSFAAEIQRGGIDGLIQQLNRKGREPGTS